MPTPILMPALPSPTEHGTLSKWFVTEGQHVSVGDIIAEIETDQATIEIEAIIDGTIDRILVLAGTAGVKNNTPLALASIDAAGNAPTPPSTFELAAPLMASPTHDAWTQTRGAAPHRPTPKTAAPPTAPVRTQTMREALRDAIAEEMRRDSDVLLMGAEVANLQSAHKVTQGLIKEFGPRRVVDTPNTEHGFAGLGIGAAFAGLKPIVEFRTWNIGLQAVDHIVNAAAKTLYMSGGQFACPIVFRGPNGVTPRAAAQHAQCFSAWYAHIPGLKVVCPSTPADAKGLLKSAIRDPNPVLVLENERLYDHSGPVPTDPDWLVPIGKANVVREGAHCTIVSFAGGMIYANAAANRLAKDGIECEVIDLRSLRPLDMPTVIASIKKTKRLVTVEEAWPICSIGSEICAQAAIQAFDDLDAPPIKVSGADVPMPYAENLEKLALPSVEQVIEAVRTACHRQK
jgi:pyruvate dehydrogenase E1 component beta subunit